MLLRNGPVAVDVDSHRFQNHKGSHFTANCGRKVNHVVVLVGWDNDNNWIIKNSWALIGPKVGMFACVEV